MSRRDLGISVGRISSRNSDIPMSKEAEGDTQVIVDTNKQVQAWGGVEGVAEGGWQKKRALQSQGRWTVPNATERSRTTRKE